MNDPITEMIATPTAKLAVVMTPIAASAPIDAGARSADQDAGTKPHMPAPR